MRKLFVLFVLVAVLGLGYSWIAMERLAAENIFCEDRVWMLGDPWWSSNASKPACPEPIMTVSGIGHFAFFAALATGVLVLARAKKSNI